MSREGSPCREYMNLKRFILPRVDCYLLLNFYSALSEMCLILTSTSRYVVHCSDNMCSCITVKSFGLFTNTQHWQHWHNIANTFPFLQFSSLSAPCDVIDVKLDSVVINELHFKVPDFIGLVH